MPINQLVRTISAALFGAGVLLLSPRAQAAMVLFDSGGFESGAGYSSGTLGAGANLSGQPSGGGTGQFTQFVSVTNPGTITAGVYGYQPFPVAGNNQQFVQLQSTAISAGNAGYFYPQTFTSPQAPYVPASGEFLAVLFTMSTGAAATGNPFFGVTLRDGNNATFGYAGINATTGAPVGLSTLASPSFTATSGTSYDYEVLIDYGNKAYSLYAAAIGAPSFTLVGSAGFLSAATNFGSAPLTSFITPGSGSTLATGFASFDNYQLVSSVPEPAVMGSFGVALVLLARRRVVSRVV